MATKSDSLTKQDQRSIAPTSVPVIPQLVNHSISRSISQKDNQSVSQSVESVNQPFGKPEAEFLSLIKI